MQISGTTSSWAITEDVVNRGMAANGSTLLNKADTTFRAVQKYVLFFTSHLEFND